MRPKPLVAFISLWAGSFGGLGPSHTKSHRTGLRVGFLVGSALGERAKALVDWPRAGLLSRMHTSASLTARPRTSTTVLCAQRSRCSLSSGPGPHGHCIYCSFASLGIAAFRALLTIRCDRNVGTTPAQMRIMATRVAWDSQERSMCIHIAHCD